MKPKLKLLLLSLLYIFLLTFLDCNNVADDGNKSQDQNSDDDKTYLQVNNNSQFDINVYFQSPAYAEAWASVKAGKAEKKEIAPSATNAGDGIYIQYLYPIGNIVIPYYDVTNSACVQVKQIREKETNLLNVPTLSQLTMDTAYLIVKNESDTDIALYDDTNPVLPLYQESYWIVSNEYKIYELKSVTSLANYKLGNGFTNKILSSQNILQGNIYTMRCTNSTVDLISVSPIDISVNSKIWKLPLSQEKGKFLSADKFGVRENSSDGYLFTGQLTYDANFRNEESSAYIAEISSSGDISDRVMTFKDSPKALKSNCFIEKNGMRIIVGEKKNSSGKMVPFIYGDKGCDFYIEPEIARFDRFDQIIFKEEGVFELLFETVSAEDEDTVQGFGIFELKISSYSEASGKIVYSDANNFAYDFIYANQEYVVLREMVPMKLDISQNSFL